MWWRVEFNPDGVITRVSLIESDVNLPNGSSVCYVQAPDEDSAKYAAYRARQRTTQKERRARLREQGLCRCGRHIDDNRFARCSTCRVRSVQDEKRSRRRKRGEQVETPSRAESFAARKRYDRQQVLLEVLKAWLAASTNREFSDWLRGELTATGYDPT
jgi:hypothetical protein